MKRFTVRVSPAAERDLLDSFDRGGEHWGETLALDWLDRIEGEIFSRLSRLPAGFLLAPESAEFEIDIRQFAFDRYRILFTMNPDEVLVLRVRGPFSGPLQS